MGVCDIYKVQSSRMLWCQVDRRWFKKYLPQSSDGYVAKASCHFIGVTPGLDTAGGIVVGNPSGVRKSNKIAVKLI